MTILSSTSLYLTAFRSYSETELLLDARPVVLTGANGSGKTNLLEAVSLLVPGKGLRRAALSDFQAKHRATPWVVAARLITPDSELQIGTGRDPDQPDLERRVVHIDGRTVRSQQALADHVAMTWIVPDMDRVLAEGPAARRKLLDRLVYSFDPAHAGRVQRYEKALRERMQILRDGNHQPYWLNALEEEMARSGAAIAAARAQLLRQLQAAIDADTGAFPQATLALQGFAEEKISTHPALLVEDELRAAWAASRAADQQQDSCAIGPHRADLLVTHRLKNMAAEYCSTGEQKALLIAIILAYIHVLTAARGLKPLVLLDDIAAHLDSVRRAALYEALRALGVQAWLTGTDDDQFATLLPYAQHMRVEQGRLLAA